MVLAKQKKMRRKKSLKAQQDDELSQPKEKKKENVQKLMMKNQVTMTINAQLQIQRTMSNLTVMKRNWLKMMTKKRHMNPQHQLKLWPMKWQLMHVMIPFLHFLEVLMQNHLIVKIL